MEAVWDFLHAALPWISIGLLLAVFFARSARKKKDEQPEDYGITGMGLGMCFGTAIGTALGNNTGIGLCLGMLVGLVIGSSIKKEEQGDDPKA